MTYENLNYELLIDDYLTIILQDSQLFHPVFSADQVDKNKRMIRRKSAFNKTVTDLAEVTTVHGLRYALTTRSHFFDRVAWAFIVIGATLGEFYTVIQ